MLMNMSEKKILLIKSGSVDRYWAYFEEICKDIKKILFLFQSIIEIVQIKSNVGLKL